MKVAGARRFLSEHLSDPRELPAGVAGGSFRTLKEGSDKPVT